MEYTQEISERKWESIIALSPFTYFFHTPYWQKIINEENNLKTATRLYNVDGCEILIPMMEVQKFGFKMLHSMPLGYGGIFSTSDISPKLIQSVIKDVVTGRNLILILNCPPFLDFGLHTDNQTYKVDSVWNYTHIINLKLGFEDIKRNFHRNFRRKIKNAQKHHVDIVERNDLDSFKNFYLIYKKRAEEWGYKEPPQSWLTFKKLYKYGGNHVRLTLAENDDIVIGGSITLEYKKNIFYWANAANSEFNVFSPNHLLLHDIIRKATERGFENFNCGSSGSLLGVKRFKESMGAYKVNISRFKIVSLIGTYCLRMNNFFQPRFLMKKRVQTCNKPGN